jgi:hypothetical protein
MEVPRHIEERLRSFDPLLFIKWNAHTCRFEVWRRDPVRTSKPPYLVTVWQYPEDRSYMPLDNRLFKWLWDADTQRRFGDRDANVRAALLLQEIEEQNAKSEVAAEKAVDDKYAGARDELEFAGRKDLRIGTPVPRTIRRKHGPALKKVPI